MKTYICKQCNTELNREDVQQQKYVCSGCGGYYAISAYDRIDLICDKGSFKPLFENIKTKNPLQNDSYMEKTKRLQESVEESESITVGHARIDGIEVVIGVCNSNFLMGTMGYAMGERITKAFEYATKRKLPVVLFSCSGGARMQEGMISLMQMEKTAAAVKQHSDKKLLFISVLTNPTFGGVSASYAMLGDIIIAEKYARVGFAGRRVIEQTINRKLPADAQTADFQLQHGMVDFVLEREKMRDKLAMILKMHEKTSVRLDKKSIKSSKNTKIEDYIISNNKSAWERTKITRQIKRPSAQKYIDAIADAFIELHGDRLYGDDRAIIGGIAYINGQPVTVIMNNKGDNLQECMECNFGMPMPEGYRKALRLMEQAEKFGRPVISFVDTAGAYPGLDAEERGQAVAIANNLYKMSDLGVPMLSIMLGEGGSGGALATAVANEVWIFENALFSIISPEGYASIIWKDGEKAEKAADEMWITSEKLLQLGIVDKIIPEYGVASEDNYRLIARDLKDEISLFLGRYKRKSSRKIKKERRKRYKEY